MIKNIKKVAVLGSGLMGGGIAALLAAVGAEVVLLDILPKELSDEDKAKGWTLETPEFRNKIVQAGLNRINDPKMMILYEKSISSRIKIGNFTDNIEWIKDCDWIVEVIIEKLEPKQAMMNQIAKYRKKGSIVSSNTSGIPVTWIVDGQDDEFKQHFLGTHFFNPVRFMKLLELIPTKYTSKETLHFMSQFGEEVLGKGIVVAKDTPDFVANRIGGFAMINAINLGAKYQLDVPTLDLLTGPVIGRPNSGTYRLADLVGIDLMVYTGQNKVKNVPTQKEKDQIKIDSVLEKMVAKGLLGDKARQGFYKKDIVAGQKVTLFLDLKTLEYKPLYAPQIACVKEALATKNKYKAIISGDSKEQQIVWELLKNVLIYSAERVPEIADDYTMIDKGMKWGYNWEKGPFEIWDAIGFQESVQRMEKEGESLPKWILDRAAKNLPFYAEKDTSSKYISLINQQYPIVDELPSARLLDIGDQVLCLEFRSKGNTINGEINEMFRRSEALLRGGKWRGLVIGNNAKAFCVGADLRYFVEASATNDVAAIENLSADLEDILLKLKYSPKPVVAAPFGNTLGGGCEIVLHCNHAVVAPETYIGLVEVGVGLLPGGGGLKEMLFKNIVPLPEKTPQLMLPVVTKVWQGIITATTAKSGFEALKKGFLPKNSRVVMNTEALLSEAKATVLTQHATYQAPAKVMIPVLGIVGIAHFEQLIGDLLTAKTISEYDAFICRKIAFVLCGGDVEAGTLQSEEQILKLERKGFAELAVQPKTQERIQYLLRNGKTMRN